MAIVSGCIVDDREHLRDRFRLMFKDVGLKEEEMVLDVAAASVPIAFVAVMDNAGEMSASGELELMASNSESGTTT